MDEKDKPEEGKEGIAKSSSATLLEKIRHTLSHTAPERWEQGGEPLDTNRRFQRPQERWEQVYCTDTKSGVLVLRSSQPITNNFHGGGYNFALVGAARYLIELRGRGWSPRALLDPSFRGSGGVEKSCQVLAEGDVAKELFHEIEQIVKHHRESLRREFNDSVARLTANIREHIGETTAGDWQSVEGDFGFKGYRTEINGITVTVGSAANDLSTSYSLTLGRFGLVWYCRDPFLMQEVFKLVDESVKTASLEQLGKVLEDML